MNHFSRASALYQDGRAKQLIPFTEPQRSDARVKALVHHVAVARRWSRRGPCISRCCI